jgi:CPA1 family monovalent cation:H+ antiporter
MILFEAILAMLVAALILNALAARIGLPYPALLALAGAGLALSPIGFDSAIDPSLALALFVAPVLLDAAYDTSLRDLRLHWIPIAGLVFVAVGVTTLAVAAVARHMVPDLGWAPAIALGAIVAPPDAAAATAVLRQVRVPHRLGVVLEGESLLNDATALFTYKLAVTAALAGGSIGAAAIAPAFLIGLFGSLIAGPVLALVMVRVMRLIDDAPTSIILQFVTTFGIWIVAERLDLSPILTTVAYAMTVARHSPAYMPARLRVPSYAVWEVAVLLLNTSAFVVIGLQLRPIIAHASRGDLHHWTWIALAVLGTTMAARLGWALAYNGTERLVGGPRLETDERPRWRGSLAVAWCGMRGIVTLAAAIALPDGFPHREMMLFVAFAVVVGTLVLQGATLRPLLAVLKLRDDEPVEREVRDARAAIAAAALDHLDGNEDREADELRREIELEREAAEISEEGEGTTELPGRLLRAETLRVRRETLLDLRRRHVIGDDAFHRIEEELDFADLATADR